jgi:hypothetical protein
LIEIEDEGNGGHRANDSPLNEEVINVELTQIKPLSDFDDSNGSKGFALKKV